MSFAPAIQLDLPWAVELLSFWKSIPFVYLLAGHCLHVANFGTEFKHYWLVHYWATFLWGFGGGITSAILIGDYTRASNALFARNEVGLVWTVCWWLVAYSPGGYVERFVKQWYILAFLKASTALLRALLIVARVDAAVAVFPGVVAAPLVLGTLAGCGGRLIVDGLYFGWGVRPGWRAEMTEPGFVGWSAFVASGGYYLTAYGLGLTSPDAAAGILVTLLVVQSLLTEPLGRPLDFTKPLVDLLHTVTLLPKASGPEPAAPAPKTPAKAGAGAVTAEAAFAGAATPSSVAGGITKPSARRSTRLAPKAA